jgi:hypothetical protein
LLSDLVILSVLVFFLLGGNLGCFSDAICFFLGFKSNLLSLSDGILEVKKLFLLLLSLLLSGLGEGVSLEEFFLSGLLLSVGIVGDDDGFLISSLLLRDILFAPKGSFRLSLFLFLGELGTLSGLSLPLDFFGLLSFRCCQSLSLLLIGESHAVSLGLVSDHLSSLGVILSFSGEIG